MNKKDAFFAVVVAVVVLFSVELRAARAGMVTLVFDDGLESVWQSAFPVLSRYGLTATVAAIAGRVDADDPDFMTSRQLHALEKAGWEIASHGLTHRRPVDIPARYTDEQCLNLRPVAGEHGLYEGRYTYKALAGLLENDRPLRERANSRLVEHAPGTYYFDALISELIVHPYAPFRAGAKDIRAVSYERELEASKQKLTALGLHVTTYITPHNYWTTPMSNLATRYYRQVAAGGDDANGHGNTNRYWLKRFVVHTDDTAADSIAIVKAHAVDKNDWVIFCMHGVGSSLGWEPWSVDRLAALCAYLKQQGVPVVTVAKGAAIWFGNTGKTGK